MDRRGVLGTSNYRGNGLSIRREPDRFCRNHICSFSSLRFAAAPVRVRQTPVDRSYNPHAAHGAYSFARSSRRSDLGERSAQPHPAKARKSTKKKSQFPPPQLAQAGRHPDPDSQPRSVFFHSTIHHLIAQLQPFSVAASRSPHPRNQIARAHTPAHSHLTVFST